MNIDKAKRLLAHLRNRTEARGATAAEAAQAAELAERIMRRFGLDDQATVDEKLELEMPTKVFPVWARILMWALESRFGVSGQYVIRRGEQSRAQFVGPEHRVSVAAWLFRAVGNDLHKASDRTAREAGYTGPELVKFRNSFSTSAAWEVYMRLLPRSKRSKVDDEPPKTNRRPRKSKPMSYTEFAAISTGSAFGRTVPLDTNAIGETETLALEFQSSR